MLALLAESALRSTALGVAVWLGLVLLRVRNPGVRMTAMTVVLAASFAMPALTPWMKWTLPIAASPTQLTKIVSPQMPWNATDEPEPTDHFVAARSAPQGIVAPVRVPAQVGDWRRMVIGIDALVTLVLLLRLVIGWVLTRRVIHAARRIDEGWAAGADIRVSDAVAVPVTFGSTIVLPSAYCAWSERKLRAVLLHEGAHVSHGDSYVLLAAAIHRALFWFNPFSWWLFQRLAELAEMVSDDAAIRGIDDPLGYAEILLDVAQNRQRLAAGLAMARHSTVRQRVERILSLTNVSARVSRRKRVLIAVVLLPPALVSASTVAFIAAPLKADRVSLARPSGARSLTIDLPPETLDRYVGYFQTGVMNVVTITREGNALFARATGEPRVQLLATSDHEFVGAEGEANVNFVPTIGGPASELYFREPNTASLRGVRIDATMASDIVAAFRRRVAAAPDRFRDQIPMAGGEATLRRAIEEWRLGTPNYAQMSPQLANNIRKRLPQLDAMLSALGALRSVSFKGVGPGGFDRYNAQFDRGSVKFALVLAPDGRLEGLNYDPDGDGTPGGVVDCALESTLDSSHDSAPIRLLLTNHSGAGLRLFRLDPDGHWLDQGRLAEEEARPIMTYVARPLVVTDATGQCVEIVLPGQQTRFHVIKPPGTPIVTRTTPVPDGEQALRRYIDSVRTGNPVYDEMTPQAAAVARQRWLQQQVILSRLGTLQSMTFQGVSETGDNLYAVRFAHGAAQWQIRLADEGRIADVSFGPPF